VLRHAGVLIGPGNNQWLRPPDGFAALYAARLTDGGVVWFHWEHANNLKICHQMQAAMDAPLTFRTASRTVCENDAHETVYFLVMTCLHAFADGHCFAPLANDLLDVYEGLLKFETNVHLPAIGEAFTLLQQRLFDTLDFRFDRVDRHSLRGSLWNQSHYGYSLNICFPHTATIVLTKVALSYAIPTNYVLLALAVISIARAGGEELVEMTLYVPMRDGFETGLVGLFADWRDIAILVSREDATIIGVILQLADTLRLRNWSVFNPLRRPERTIVNFDVRGFRHGSFWQLRQQDWQGGGSPRYGKTRGNRLRWLQQPLSLNLEQDSNCWSIYVRMDYSNYPPCWAERFVKAMKSATWELVFCPMSFVHKSDSSDII